MKQKVIKESKQTKTYESIFKDAKEQEDKLIEHNPAHYCLCGEYIGFKGFCSKKCHDEYYDMFKDKQ